MKKWETVKTSELIAQEMLFIGDGYRAKNSELSPSGIPFARAGNINGGSRFDNADFLPNEYADFVAECRNRNPKLQQWAARTELRLSLERLNWIEMANAAIYTDRYG